MLPFTAVHHVAIICTDLEAAKQFYVDKLGFTVLRETHRADRNDCKLDLKLGDMELELFVKPDAPARPARRQALLRGADRRERDALPVLVQV